MSTRVRPGRVNVMVRIMIIVARDRPKLYDYFREAFAGVDQPSRDALAGGLPLAERFRGLPVEMLATDTIRVISRPLERCEG